MLTLRVITVIYDNNNKLLIYYQNVRGLRTKTDNFYRQMSLSSYHVIVLTETWLLDGVFNTELFDERYIVWRRDRDYSLTGQSRGGGVLIATRKDLVVRSEPLFHSTAEDLWLSMRLTKNNSHGYINLHICVIYLCNQNHGLSFSAQLGNFLRKLSCAFLSSVTDKFLILGDFNMSGIEWVPSDHHYLVPNNVTTNDEVMFTDEICTLGLAQYNGVLNQQGKMLDLILSSDLVNVSECSDPLVPIDSYHPALVVTTNFYNFLAMDCAPRTHYVYSKGDYKSINRDIDGMDWDQALSSLTMDESVDFFVNTISDLQNKYIPHRVIHQNSFPKWYSRSLIKTIREKHKYHKRFNLYGNKSDEYTFKLLRKRAKTMESECYTNYLSLTEQSIKNNPKHFWSFVKSRYNSNAIPSSLYYENDIQLTGETACAAFSSYFNSTFLNPTDSNSTSHGAIVSTVQNLTTNCVTDLGRIEIEVEDVTKLLQNLDVSKGAGPDNISSRFLVNCSTSISYPISILFKKSLSLCTVPRLWKSAFITPVHKKGTKTLVTNYRPISKLCIIAKIFERIVYKQLYSSLASSFSPHQHGFLKGRSTVTNLAIFNNFLTEAMDNGEQVDVIYTDYSKAFDRIDHDILLMKLNAVGIHGDLLRWFSSYIANRTQAVVLNNYISSWVSIPSGVPQGSLLGPLLFIIYVNDIDSCLLSSSLLCFADDMKIFSKISCPEDMVALQTDLDRLEAYCEKNKLDLNVTKCSVITYTRKIHILDTKYSLGGLSLRRCNTVCDLGVHHDSKLSFESHVDSIIKKASKALGFIMRISKCFKEVKTLKILYCTFVRSHLEYASLIWNPLYHKYTDRIENVQKRFIKYLCFRLQIPYHSDNYIQLCKKHHLLPLYLRRDITDFIFILKVMNSDIDSSDLLMNLNFNVPQRSTRYLPPLRIPNAFTNYRQNSCMVRAVRYFNESCKQHDIDPFTVSVSAARRLLSQSFFN